MRLTIKDKKGNHYSIVRSNTAKDITDFTDKLGELEDIEEELGFTFKKLLNIDKVWFKWENVQFQRVYVFGVDIKRKMLIGKMSNRQMTLKLQDYGKTWALTKEELE
jgi:hypothetical protein